MEFDHLLPIISALYGVWLVVLSLVFYWLVSHYKRLVKDDKEGDLKRILDKILKTGEENKKELASLGKKILELEKEGTFHIQKTGLVRYSPFQATGGDQSFSLAALDGTDSGFVITGLHARERTRVYVKSVKTGKSTFQLSKEEMKAIKEAKKQ